MPWQAEHHGPALKTEDEMEGMHGKATPGEPAVQRAPERSTGGLLADALRDLGLLMRQEIALAKAEMLGKFGQLGFGAGLLGAAGVLAFAGLLYLMAAAMMALMLVLPGWAAALIVGGAVLVLALVLALIGRAKTRTKALMPERTIKTMKENASWMKEQVQ
jgi:hypothetical protein